MKVLAPYLLGGVLVSIGGVEIGSLAILYALLRDWRFWLLCIVAFSIGLWWD